MQDATAPTKSSALPVIIAYIFVITAAITIPPIAFTSPKLAMKSLSEAGYSDIQIQGYAALGCKNADENLRTSFSGRSPTEADVTGIVCQTATGMTNIVIDSTTDPRRAPITLPVYWPRAADQEREPAADGPPTDQAALTPNP